MKTSGVRIEVFVEARHIWLKVFLIDLEFVDTFLILL
jgi:hypothetical protein